ncbi:hypothetical protein GLOIN_2v1471513 [Rhizophagus irregularis DAOM 181602=DAOM 197198]|nr:hypothetical protein GLOIN_2v1471513 [Rhizophagus irregularis DAOM 181602=DAOM 197198]
MEEDEFYGQLLPIARQLREAETLTLIQGSQELTLSRGADVTRICATWKVQEISSDPQCNGVTYTLYSLY